jgi:hypothetical protein
MSPRPGEPGAPTLLLRLSVPLHDGFHPVREDLAKKVAEYVGCGPDAPKVVEILESLARQVAPASPNGSGDITFEFHQLGDELKIDASCGGRSSTAAIKV